MVIKREHRIFAVGLALISFLLLFAGVRFVLGNQVDLNNIMVYMVFSVIVSLVATTLLLVKYQQAFLVFMFGLLAGYVAMYRAFLGELNGWGDLVGILSLLMFAGAGLAAGLVVQLIYQLFRKRQQMSRKS